MSLHKMLTGTPGRVIEGVWTSLLPIREGGAQKVKDVGKVCTAQAGILVVYVFHWLPRICLWLKNLVSMHLASFQIPVEIVAIPSNKPESTGTGGTFHSQTKGPL